MNKIAFFLAVLATVLLAQCYPAAAQMHQTFVSISGNDGNTASSCQESAPCRTIDAALTVTNTGGTLVCLDTGLIGNSRFEITQSVTIDCHDRLVAPGAESFACGEDGIVINAPGGIVTLRNINTDGNYIGYSYQADCGYNGIHIEAAAMVNLEDCVIESYSQSGITVTTSANTILDIHNTTIRNVGNGISFAPSGGSVNGSMDHSKIIKTSANGITTSGAVYFTVSNSRIVNAAGVGVAAAPGAVLEVDSSSVSNNRTAFATTGGTIRISRNVIYDNTTNYSISGGTIATSGDNKAAANGSTVPNGTITEQ